MCIHDKKNDHIDRWSASCSYFIISRLANHGGETLRRLITRYERRNVSHLSSVDMPAYNLLSAITVTTSF